MRFSIRTRGFSLLELLFVLMLVLILTDLAWPSWRHFLVKTNSRTLLGQLVAALSFTRQEALLRRVVVSLCGSRDQENCSASWSQGFIVFIDSKQNGRLEAKSQILKVFHRGQTEGVLHWRAFPLNKESCQFLPSGTTSHENGTFWYCVSSGEEPVWALVLNQAGRFRISYPDSQGRLRDERGLPLSC